MATSSGGRSINGNKFSNSITGSAGNDKIWGLGGNDTLSGLDGDDLLDGGDGNDSLVGGAGNDQLLGGSGSDRLLAGPGNDTVDGGTGTDTAVLQGSRAAFSVLQIDATTVEITSATGTARFSNVETFSFDDLTLSFDQLVYVPVPNLAAGAFSLSDASLAPGEPGLVSFQVASNGEVAASAGVVLEIVTQDGQPVTTVTLPAIAGLGVGATATRTYDLSTLALPPGNYAVRGVVDPNNTARELNEGDNSSPWQSFSVETPVCDLAITSVSINAAASDFDLTSGASIALDLVLENHGNVPSGTRAVEIYLQVGPIDGVTSMIKLDTVTVTLAPGATVNLSHTQPLSSTIPAGNWQIVAAFAADPGAAVPDLNPGNDQATASVALIGGTIRGGAGSDLITGSLVDEFIFAGSGNDTIVASGGTDTIHGEAGTDTVDFSGATGGILLFGSSGSGQTTIEVFAPGETPVLHVFPGIGHVIDGVEAVVGSNFGDKFMLEASEFRTILALDGNDTIRGGDGNDTVDAGAGNDLVTGEKGDDLITLGTGADTFQVSRTRAEGIGYLGGADIVTDFDPSEDMILIGYNPSAPAFDPLEHLTQTAEGVRIDYATGSSILLQGLTLDQLNPTNVVLYQDIVLTF